MVDDSHMDPDWGTTVIVVRIGQDMIDEDRIAIVNVTVVRTAAVEVIVAVIVVGETVIEIVD